MSRIGGLFGGGAPRGPSPDLGKLVRSGARAVGKSARQGLEAVEDVVGDAARGAGSLAGTAGASAAEAVRQVAEPSPAVVAKAGPDVGKEIEGYLPRVGDAAGSVGSVFVDGTIGAAKNIGEGLEDFFVRGPRDIVSGRFGKGLGRMALAPVKILVQTPLDLGILTAGKTVSALQTLVGLEPAGRTLTAEERTELEKVYGDSIDYESVRVKEGSSGILTVFDRSFVLGNTIYISPSATPAKDNLSTVVHEGGHVWQHQNGGTDYLSEALWGQMLGIVGLGPGYDYEKDLAAGKSWDELNPEQQAQLVQDAYEDGFFDDPQNGTFVVAGNDYTEMMKAVANDLEDAEGTP